MLHYTALVEHTKQSLARLKEYKHVPDIHPDSTSVTAWMLLLSGMLTRQEVSRPRPKTYKAKVKNAKVNFSSRCQS